jgi:uncharacterized protein (DUF2141 family)
LLVCPLVLTLALAAQLADPPSTAIVAGRVVDAGTLRPLAGVVVTPAGSAVVTSPGASGPARVLTNANGQFVLRGLAKGSLVLTATKGGYVNATHGQRRPGGSTQPIPVEAGQRITDVELRMWKYAAITGSIVDEAGDPVVGTRVQALQKTFVASRRRFTPGPAAATDDRGMYRIAGLTPGEYLVMVPSTQTAVPTDVMESFFTGTPISDARRRELGRELNGIGSAIAPAGSPYAMKAGGQTFSLQPGTLTPIVTATGILVYPTAYYPSAATAGQATAVPLRSGEERGGIDLQLRPLRGVRVSGTLMGPDGPSATTGVRLVPAVPDDTMDPLDVAATITDSSGAFTFPAVPAGQYALRVVRVPRPPVNVDEMRSITPSGTMTISSTPGPAAGPPPIPPDATLVAQMPLAVGERDIIDLIVPLAPGPRVSGRIEFDGTSERPSAESMTGIRITLDPADGTRLGDSTLALQTGRPEENGEFRTYGVPPGRYVLRVSPLPAGWFLRSALYQNRDIADMPLELESKDVAGIVITFTDRPASLAGTVRGAEGPDPTAVVLAYPVDASAWSSSGALSRRMRTARAAKDGSYSMQALPAGEYYLVAVKEDQVGEWQDPALLRALSSLAQTIRLLDGEQKTLNLTAAILR